MRVYSEQEKKLLNKERELFAEVKRLDKEYKKLTKGKVFRSNDNNIQHQATKT